MWRWDLGRLSYFSVDKIQRIASVIVALDGTDLSAEPDPIRAVMPAATGLSFKPENYRIWRNYARTFKILGLGSKINDRLVATGLCKKIIFQNADSLTYDEYIQYIARTFYYPSPAFQGYDSQSPQSFPFCAILKYLISKSYSVGEPSITPEEALSILIGNNVTGFEPIAKYRTLPKIRLTGNADTLRHVREMFIFISQLSYLSLLDDKLFIDIEAFSNLGTGELESLVMPIIRPRNLDPEVEIHNMYKIEYNNKVYFDFKEPINIEDTIFTEGKKTRITHLRTERNKKVMQHYFENSRDPTFCDVCKVEVANKYPWLSNLIEIHHVLPLSSPLRVDKTGTSMNDLVGLCPNCHLATHAFYKSVLSAQGLIDFKSDDHAREVYLQVKSKFISS